jgi:hypothetical protein
MMMKPRWSKGVEKPKELEAEFMAAENVINRLVEMLNEDIEASLKRMRGYATDDIPNLSEAYAAELAKQETLLDIVKLLR